jgi:hypothetical protein
MVPHEASYNETAAADLALNRPFRAGLLSGRYGHEVGLLHSGCTSDASSHQLGGYAAAGIDAVAGASCEFVNCRGGIVDHNPPTNSLVSPHYG